ncbi:MAG: hypothetical protein Q7U99_22360 [Rubrivivax sp.]|nr:hypothetical protein [Rubrivivax sp.]
MRSIISGLIGGLIAALLTAYIANRVGKGAEPGQLRYGKFMWILAVSCLVFALLPVASSFAGNDKDFWAKVALFIGFGIGSIYCFGEAAMVKGSFNEHGIAFYTPWSGRKDEKWSDLVSMEFVASCSWYTLAFRSGKRIRLSQYLAGHRAAVEMAETQSPLSAASDA